MHLTMTLFNTQCHFCKCFDWRDKIKHIVEKSQTKSHASDNGTFQHTLTLLSHTGENFYECKGPGLPALFNAVQRTLALGSRWKRKLWYFCLVVCLLSSLKFGQIHFEIWTNNTYSFVSVKENGRQKKVCQRTCLSLSCLLPGFFLQTKYFAIWTNKFGN